MAAVKEMMPVGQVAKLAKVSRQAVLKWVKSKKLRCVEIGAGATKRLLFKPKDVEAFLAIRAQERLNRKANSR